MGSFVKAVVVLAVVVATVVARSAAVLAISNAVEDELSSV